MHEEYDFNVRTKDDVDVKRRQQLIVNLSKPLHATPLSFTSSSLYFARLVLFPDPWPHRQFPE